MAGDDKDLRAKAIDAANKPYVPTPSPSLPPSGGFSATFSTSSAEIAAPVAAVAAFAPAVATGFGGKEAPAQPLHPEL